MPTTFWHSMGYNFSFMIASDTLFDSRGWVFGDKLPNKDNSRDRGCKGRCHGNQFWDYISCKWTLTGDNEMRLSYKEWFVFSQPLLLIGRSLWIRSCGDGNCSRRATVRLGIDTLIANILVSNYLDHLLFARQLTSRRTTSIVANQVCCYCRNWNIILANHFGVLRARY